MLFSRNKKKIKKITCLSAIFAGVLSSASFLSSCSDQLKPEVNSILLSTDADKEITGIICEQGEFDPNFNIVFDDIDGVPIDDNIDKVYYEFENNPYPKNIKIDKDSGVIS
ncbi:MAG: hypothetical protein K2L48_03480 [Mycoplasmoidaceae bacterium]|nr:hypothetical protein [Mycoplasmoidaceae bacterium]